MNIQAKIGEFKRQGFVNLGSSFLNTEDIDELCSAARSVYDAIPSIHPDAIQDDGIDGVLNLPLHDQRVGELVSKIVSNTDFRAFLKEILGEGCKIWDISLRRSRPGNKGLYLHQDGVGQVNMAICLDENRQGIGATAILPSSHLVMSSIRKLKAEVPPFIVNWFSFLFVPLAGAKGDIAFFSNRVWHGRFNNLSDSAHDVILIGFFPEGYRYSRSWPDEFINGYQGSALGELLAAPRDVEGSIPSNCECREAGDMIYSKRHSYSLDIENLNFLSNARKPMALVLSVLVLRVIMWLGRISRSLRNNLRLF